ncbi:T9SS type A sorting domain-containing protein [Aquimarina rubra]|uniref:T9SS type A sorting domain-containing protein n=1 Tax=Aquimarina rubra TaxID=1920033 RepID=A0ABW5LGB6_9FLAO
MISKRPTNDSTRSYFKVILCFLVYFIFYNSISAQQEIIESDANTINKLHPNFKNRLKNFSKPSKILKAIHGKKNIFITDTIKYIDTKTTGLRALDINNSNSAQAASQYFDVPNPLTINGVTFYAWYDGSAGVSTTIEVEVQLTNNDSLPTNVPIAQATISVDTTFGTGSLNEIKKMVMFNPPVTVTQPYVIVIKNLSPNNINLVSNDYIGVALDGQQEWLASIDLFGNWTRSYDVLVGGQVFDADWLIEPYISYDTDTDFSISPPTNSGNNMVTVESNGTIDLFIENRMYNQNELSNQSNLSYAFDFGDGSNVINNPMASHTYATGNSQTITLTNTIVGWTNTYLDVETKVWAPTLSNGQDLDRENILIYPNPTYKKFNITTDKPINNISIYNNAGQEVLKYKKPRKELNIEQLSTGVYFINVTTDQGTYKTKLIKQ